MKSSKYESEDSYYYGQIFAFVFWKLNKTRRKENEKNSFKRYQEINLGSRAK